jgi:hypothetical protein
VQGVTCTLRHQDGNTAPQRVRPRRTRRFG